MNPTVEDAYWRDNYSKRPYASADQDYGSYQPANAYGWESHDEHKGRSWADVEHELANGWDSRRGKSRLDWAHAKEATRDAWNRPDGKTR